MKILIVDDETFVRLGIKTTFDWNKYGFEVIGDAEDGVEATEIFMKYKPDIVLVDILMPRMNGLEFIKNVKDINPYCRFIILSCHDEFEYMRESIKLGVRDYIMKTEVKRDELLEVVNRVAGEIELERKKINELDVEKRENFINRPIVIRNFLNDVIDKIETDEIKISNKIVELQLDFFASDLYIVLISVDNYRKLRQEREPKHYELLVFGIQNIAQEISRQYSHSYVIKRNEKEIICFVSFDKYFEKKQTKQNLLSLTNDIVLSVKEFLNINISIGISNCINRFGQAGEGYKQALKALGMRFFTGIGSVNFAKDFNDGNKKLIQRIRNFESEITSMSTYLNFEEILNQLNSLKESEELRFGDDPKQIKNMFLKILLNIIKKSENEVLIRENMEEIGSNLEEVLNVETLNELIDYLQKIVLKISKLLEVKYSNNNKKLINIIKEYLLQNAQMEITLNDAAEHVNLSPGYFSRLFKKETGENFIDYVIKVKIERAKGMIRSGEKLWMIAQSLGYTEVSSFSRIFKKIEGISPQQYKISFISNMNK